MAKWDMNAVNALINAYKDRPLLYNPQHTLNSNRLARIQAEKQIAAIVSHHRPRTTIRDVTTKIHSMRSYFLREYTKILNARKSGQKNCVSILRYYDRFKFIIPYLKTPQKNSLEKCSSANLIENSEDCAEDIQEVKEVVTDTFIDTEDDEDSNEVDPLVFTVTKTYDPSINTENGKKVTTAMLENIRDLPVPPISSINLPTGKRKQEELLEGITDAVTTVSATILNYIKMKMSENKQQDSFTNLGQYIEAYVRELPTHEKRMKCQKRILNALLADDSD